jgi:hypothetical protein
VENSCPNDRGNATCADIHIIPARNCLGTTMPQLDTAQNEDFSNVADFENVKNQDFEQFS